MSRVSTKIYNVIIIAFVALSAVLFWWSYSDTYFTGDEIIFCHRIDRGVDGLIIDVEKTADEVGYINTPADVVISQSAMWRYNHGRNIITGVEQLFSGAIDTSIFYVINTMVWVYCVWITVWIGVKGRWRKSLWIWLLTVFCYLFLFPGEADLFTSINFSTNYLWPIAMTLTAIALWQRSRGMSFSDCRVVGVALAMVMVILAWSHEAWCLPVSATLAVWYIWVKPKERRTLAFVLTIGYWLGSLILLSSPGNFKRTSTDIMPLIHAGVLHKLTDSIVSVTYSNIFWILVVVLAVWGVWRPRRIWDFIKATRFWWILGVFCMLFVMVFHTIERSFTAVDMVSLVILLRFIPYSVKSESTANVNRWPWLASLLMVGVISMMYYVAQLQRKVTAVEKAGLEYYKNDPDGLTVVDYPEIPTWCEAWVRLKLGPAFMRKTINWEYSNYMKPQTVLSSHEFELLDEKPEQMFVPEKRVGQSPFYTDDKCYSAWSNDTTTQGQYWRWELEPASVDDRVNLLRKLGRVFLKPLYFTYSGGSAVEQVNVNGCTYYRFDKIPGRGLKDAQMMY